MELAYSCKVRILVQVRKLGLGPTTCFVDHREASYSLHTYTFNYFYWMKYLFVR